MAKTRAIVGAAPRVAPFTALVPKAALDQLVAAFDEWYRDRIDDADLIDSVGDFVERLAIPLPSTGRAFRNTAAGVSIDRRRRERA